VENKQKWFKRDHGSVSKIMSYGNNPKGTNYLICTDTKKIIDTVSLILDGKGKPASILKYWDGNTGDRLIKILIEKYLNDTRGYTFV